MLHPPQYQSTALKWTELNWEALTAFRTRGEESWMMRMLAFATPSLTLAVCAGNSFWLGKNVQLEVQKMCSWIWPLGSYRRKRGRETLLSFFISYVGWVMCRFDKCSICNCWIHLFLIESFGSEYCQRAAGLFVCQSYFPLCDCRSGYLYLASKEECERLSMVECEEEWISVRQYGIPLPNCTDLPEEVTS